MGDSYFYGPSSPVGDDRRIKIFGTSTFTLTSSNSLVGVLEHESGHAFQSFNPSTYSEWQDALNYDKTVSGDLSVTRYGGNSVYEDFAESWRDYQQVKGTNLEADYREKFPSRWALLDKYWAASIAGTTNTGSTVQF